MEIAVLADIHSNHIALERCMGHVLERGIRKFLFLGDYIGEFAYPERTMALLREYDARYDCFFVRGNKEEYWLRHRDCGEKDWGKYHKEAVDSTTGVLFYAYHHLAAEDLDFFQSLPIAARLSYGEAGALPALIACHGTPADVSGEMLPGSREAERFLEKAAADLVLHGHTHIQGVTVHRGKKLLNPGSVGLSLQAGAKAQFAILHGEDGRWREELCSLSYDKERACRELEESGLKESAPWWCRVTEELLRHPEKDGIGHAEVLCRAMELCRQKTGACHWPDIPGECWEKAAEELLCI